MSSEAVTEPAPEPAAGATVPAARRTVILGVLCAGMFMAMLDNVVVSNALPRIGQDLDAGLSGLQWTVEAYSLAFAALLLPGGSLGDRFGRRQFFLAGLSLFTASSAVCALAPSLEVLIAGRVLQGIGAALLVPQSLAILRVTFTDPAEQTKAFSTWSMVSALGLAVGPALGGPLVETFGWPSAFWINVPIGLATVIVAARVLPSVPGRAAGRESTIAGQVAGAGGLALLVYGLIEAPDRGWTSSFTLACLALAVAALAFFVRSQARTTQPAFDLALVRHRMVGSAMFAGFAVSFGMFGIITFLGLFMQNVLGWSPTGAGIASLPSTAFIILVSPLAVRLTLKHGAALPLSLGLGSCALALAGLSLFGSNAHYWQYFWTLPLMGIGMGLCFTPITVVIMLNAPLDRAGAASATSNAFREVGGVAGIAVMGTLITTRLSDSLSDRLADANVDPATAQQIVDTTTEGGATGFGSPSTPALDALIGEAFVDGLHLAQWAGAGFLAVTAAAVAIIMTRRQPATG
ncbi:MFS transporter [Kineosporia babensis]|uniref:MFS transporter n=1 Tax=Kineosporia babensis TaxID=499548 RepID=A0A9X1SXW3_9ACTN|nr:MFS transporter [Kineosporia babensis]MCD5316406.1 MFS transporter [Kineosporia babensis]